MRLWCRAVCLFLMLFVAIWCVDLASAQTLVNGANQTGTIFTNTTDSYNFTANKGDTINLRAGTTGFNGYLQLYGPGSVLVASIGGYKDDLIENYVATNSGTFTVQVSAWSVGGTGTYVLNLAQTPEAFIVPSGDEGGPLTNGADAVGTITVGDQDMWTFTANKGDTINLRAGTTGFTGFIELFGPTGALLASTGGYTDDLIENYVATNSGTFTVLVSAWSVGGTGTYVLNLAQTPEAFIVPGSDEGGPLTNGADAAGTITVGDQDMWTFTANKGDTINLRAGTTGFTGFIELFGPTGALLASTGGYTDDLIEDYVATNSGTFTVLVSGWGAGGTGTYVLNLAQMPEPFVVPAGDQGGAMAGSANYSGTINRGDQDIWTFTACTGDSIGLGLNTTNFNGFLELYGSSGTLLKSSGGSTVSSLAYTATNCGTFTVLVSSWGAGGTGTYGLTADGLIDDLRLCSPVISGASLTLNGVGGPTNAVFVLYSATNIATPFGLWTPVITNQFNQFGVFTYTNGYNPAPPQRYFRFVLP